MSKQHYASIVVKIEEDNGEFYLNGAKVTSTNLNQMEWDSMLEVADLDTASLLMDSLYNYQEMPN